MKSWLRLLLAAFALFAALPAWSAMSCSIAATPAQVTGIYNYFGNLTLQGTFDVTCTRNPNTDTQRPTIWIGVDEPAGGATATQETGTSTLTYTVYHRSAGSGIWTNTGSVTANSTGTGGVQATLNFGGRGSTVTASYTFYIRVPSFQFKPAGVYDDTLNVTLRLGNDTGAVLSTVPLEVLISIPRECHFSTAPGPIAITYPAFSTTAVTGASTFGLTCTQGTTYTLSLDVTRSVVPTVELAYSLSLSGGNGTGTALSQSYTVNVSVDPGQAGRCSGATCTGTDTRTITVTY